MAARAGSISVYFSGLGGKFVARSGVSQSSPLLCSVWFKGRPTITSSLGGVPPTMHYKMRAQDSGAASPGYVTWTATGSPDFAGDSYSKGAPTPVGPMVPGSAVVATDYEE